MTKAKMDYLWAPKSEGVVSGILDHIGINKVGDSGRYPAGVKYDCLIAIRDVLMTNDDFASMVASGTHGFQSDRGPKGQTPQSAIKSLTQSLARNQISETDLKKAMKQAGLI